MRFVRVMCSGRVDLEFLLRAFSNGQDGVFVGGCRLNECNYVTQGNYDALGNVLLCKRILRYVGLNPNRIQIRFLSASEGNYLADCINAFVREVQGLGPLGSSEGLPVERMRLRIEGIRKLVPYLRLVERERMRIHPKTEEAYLRFYESEEFERLFQELVSGKAAISQILLALKEKARSTGELAGALDLSPSDIARTMNMASRFGFVRYDTNDNRYALA